MFQWLKRIFSGNSDSSEASTVNAFDDRSDWQWERADEFSYEHYTDAIEDIKHLKREKEHKEVIKLLEWCIDYTEAEAESEECVASVPAPAYYRHLGIVLRKEGRYQEEIAVLERYKSWFDARNENPREKLINRLERAKELAE